MCRRLQTCQSLSHKFLATLFEKWATMITQRWKRTIIFALTLLIYLTLASFIRLEAEYDWLEAPWFPKVSL